MRTEENLSPEWEAIKAEYLAGIKSIRAIAKDHGVSDTAIRKKAKKDEWGSRSKPGSHPRERVANLVVAGVAKAKPDDAVARPAEAVTANRIELAAEVDPEELAQEGMVVLQMLLAEIKAEGVHQDWLESVIEEETEADKSPRRYVALMKAVSAPVRAAAVKNIVLALQTAASLGPGKKATAKAAAKEMGTGRFATPATPPSFRNMQ